MGRLVSLFGLVGWRVTWTRGPSARARRLAQHPERGDGSWSQGRSRRERKRGEERGAGPRGERRAAGGARAAAPGRASGEQSRRRGRGVTSALWPAPPAGAPTAPAARSRRRRRRCPAARSDRRRPQVGPCAGRRPGGQGPRGRGRAPCEGRWGGHPARAPAPSRSRKGRVG